MEEIKGDLWAFHREGKWIVIPTNLSRKNDGSAVMGKGLAKQAAQKYPNLPLLLGSLMVTSTKRVHMFSSLRLICLPTKRLWWGKSDLNLIEEGCKTLVDLSKTPEIWDKGYMDIYLPRLGCGLGGLSWGEVKDTMGRILKSKKFKVVDNEG